MSTMASQITGNLAVQQLVWANIKENFKAPRYFISYFSKFVIFFFFYKNTWVDWQQPSPTSIIPKINQNVIYNFAFYFLLQILCMTTMPLSKLINI